MTLDLDEIERRATRAQNAGFDILQLCTADVFALVTRARAHDDAVKVIREMAEALEPFAKAPAHGVFGGPLTCATCLYEDGSGGSGKYIPDHSVLGHEPFRNARAILTNPLVVAARKGGGE